MNSNEKSLYNAKLASAIDNACRVLPSDCEIKISLQQGAGFVSLWVDGAETEFPSNRESLAETIDDAVDYAQSMNG